MILSASITSLPDSCASEALACTVPCGPLWPRYCGRMVLQLAEAAHVALAPRGHAVAQPVFLALDRLAELVLFQLFGLQHLVAPGLEMAKAACRAGATCRGRARRWRSRPFRGSGGRARSGRARCAVFCSSPSSHSMVGRSRWLVGSSSSRISGSGASDAGKGCAAGFAAGKVLRVFLAGQPEMREQVGDAIGIVARPKPRFGIGLHGRVSRRNPAPVRDSGPSRPDGGRPRPTAPRPGRRRSSAASTCPSRCGRRGRSCRRAPPAGRRRPDSGAPPKLRKISSSFRMGGAKIRLRKGHRGGRARWRGRWQA